MQILIVALALSFQCAPYRVSLGRDNSAASVRSADNETRADIATADDGQQLTDAQRITRLMDSIDADTKRLAELQSESDIREEALEEARRELTNRSSDLSPQQRDLERLRREGRAEEAADVQRNVDALDNARQLAQDKVDLAAQRLRATNEQIETLNEKLNKDQLALDRLKGTTPDPASTEVDPSVTTTAPLNTTPDTAEGDPVSEPQSTVSSSAAPEAAAADDEIPENREKPAFTSQSQLEAKEEAEKAAQEAAGAEQAVVEQVERKTVLKEDIALEKELLDAARKLAETLRNALQADQTALKQQRATGEPATQLQSLQQGIDNTEAELEETRNEIRRRASRLTDLQDQLSVLQQEELSLLQAAEEKRREAEAAERTRAWLESPFHPANIKRWAAIRGPKLLFILVAMFVLRAVATFTSRRLARLIIRGAPGSREERENRATTLAAAFRYAATATVMIGGTLLFLDAAGMDITTLLGGAAVLGLAVAFGAQSLLKDYFCGFIILLENQYSINDVVRIGDLAGLVERITLRMTALRDLGGNIHFIPNGNISSVTNMTHTWSRALFDVEVAYKEDVDEVISLLKQIGSELRDDPSFGPLILDELEMLGVDQFADSAVVIKFFIKTKPLQQWTIKREMLRRIKNRFDEQGIEIPFPHRTVYHHVANGKEHDNELKLLRGLQSRNN